MGNPGAALRDISKAKDHLIRALVLLCGLNIEDCNEIHPLVMSVLRNSIIPSLKKVIRGLDWKIGEGTKQEEDRDAEDQRV